MSIFICLAQFSGRTQHKKSAITFLINSSEKWSKIKAHLWISTQSKKQNFNFVPIQIHPINDLKKVDSGFLMKLGHNQSLKKLPICMLEKIHITWFLQNKSIELYEEIYCDFASINH